MEHEAEGALAGAQRAREILVVDDLPEIGQFFAGLVRHMKAFDVRMTTVTDPAKAVELLREMRFDLVISDFRMKGLDGIDVLEAARASNAECGRVLMTGYNEIPAPMGRIVRARIDAYVQKPLKSQDLMLLMFHFLNRDADAVEAYRRRARELETLGSREERATL